MIITAFDPGRTTGLFQVDTHLQTWYAWQREVDDLEDLGHLKMDFRLAVGRLVGERFDITLQTIRSHQDRSALDVLGWVNIEMPGRVELIARNRKEFGSKDRLRKLGWWEPSMPHAMDAARLAMVYAVDNDDVWVKETLGL